MTPVRLLNTEMLFVLAGAFLLLVAWRIAREADHPRRWGSAAFWGLLGVTLALGPKLPPVVIGYAVLAMVALAATGQVKRGNAATTSVAERASSAALSPRGSLHLGSPPRRHPPPLSPARRRCRCPSDAGRPTGGRLS